MILVLLVACGDVTNAVFAEDAEFVAVLPSEEHTTFDVPGVGLTRGAKAAIGERPELLSSSIDVAGAVNGVIFDILGFVDEVRGLAPSARSADSRTWGPVAACGGDLTATIVRSGASQFDWGFTGARAGTGTEFLAGTHFAGRSVSDGDGSFTWDHAAYGAFCAVDTAGRLEVDYDNRVGVDLLVDLDALRTEGPDVWDAAYAYRYVDGEGDFQYRTSYDLPDDGTDEPATVSVRTRWAEDGGGRADAVLTGGGLADRTMEWTQCWGADLDLTYQHDSLGVTPDEGDAAACRFGDFATVDRL